MNKILVVTEGEYSDYHIKAVFSEEYEDVAKKVAGRHGFVEEWEINTNAENYRQGLWPYSVIMLGNGNEARAERCTYPPRFHSFENGAGRWVRDGVWARDETHAIKIMNERRTVWLATGMWPEASDDS